jgi:hypothetical protein
MGNQEETCNQDNQISPAIRQALQELQESYQTLKRTHSLSPGAAPKFLPPGTKTTQWVVETLQSAIDERGDEFLNEPAVLDLNRFKLRRDKPECLKHQCLKAYKELLVRMWVQLKPFGTDAVKSISIVLA